MANVNLTLLGTLTYEDLKQIHGSSVQLLNSMGWRGSWPTDLLTIIEHRNHPEQSISPDQFFERLYHLEDLGVFHLDTHWANKICIVLISSSTIRFTRAFRSGLHQKYHVPSPNHHWSVGKSSGRWSCQ